MHLRLGYASWEGTATGDRGVMVTILGKGDRAVLLVGGVTVSPRKWKLDTQEARSKPEWVDDIEGWPTAWGLYTGGLPSPEELKSTAQGSGPWEGTWILDGQPTITAATMYYHNDLDVDGDGPEYPIVDTIDAKVIEECAVPDSVVDAGLVGVYPLNDICDYSARVDGFRTKVIAHEERHETSLNECIGTVNNDGRMAAVEAIVGKRAAREDRRQEAAWRLWTKGVAAPLFNARETAQGPESADIWKYRPGPWKYGLETKGHNGTDGCPQ